MAEDLDARAFRAFVDYVRGDSAEPKVLSDLKGVPRAEAHRVLDLHRMELERIDPARSVILESIL